MTGFFQQPEAQQQDTNYDGFYDGQNKVVPDNSEFEFMVTDGFCGIEEGKSQLWIAFDEDELNIEGAIVTTVETYPHKTMLCWALCGGENFHDWHKPMYDLIERFRKEQGLDGSELIGRKAWCRFMKQYGWEERFAFLDFFPEEEGVQNVA